MDLTNPPTRSILTRIDDAVVPRLQRGAASVARVLGTPLRAVLWVENRFFGRIARFGYRNRSLVAFVAVAVGFSAAAVHAQRYPEIQRRLAEERAAAEALSVREAGSYSQGTGSEGALAGGAVAVGPPVGADLEDYADERGRALATVGARDRRVAIVSFTEFLSAEEAAELLPASIDLVLAQYRIPISDAPNAAGSDEELGEVEIIGGDLEASVGKLIDVRVADLQSQEDEFRSYLESGVDSEDYRRDFENRLEELKAARNVLAGSGAIVFAVVVEGQGSDLQSLATLESVRLVDPAPAEIDVDASAFFGVRPDDNRLATFGRAG